MKKCFDLDLAFFFPRMYSEGFLFILWGYGTFRVVGVGIVVARLRRWPGVSHGRHGVWEHVGRWIRLVGIVRHVSRGRGGEWWLSEVPRACLVRLAAWPGIVLRARHRESCTASETVGFRGPVRGIACVCVSG